MREDEDIRRLESAIAAGTIRPSKYKKDTSRPTGRPGAFGSEVLPFGFWLGIGFAAIAGGLTAFLIFAAHILFENGMINIDLSELWPAAVLLGICFFGIGVSYGIAANHQDFLKRLWRVDKVESEYEPAGPAPGPASGPSQSVYIELPEESGEPGTYSKMPGEPKPDALRKFCQAVILNQKPLSEAGAYEFGYGRKKWEALRDYLLEKGIIYWKNPAEPRQGLELTNGGRAVFRAIAAAKFDGNSLPVPAPIINSDHVY